MLAFTLNRGDYMNIMDSDEIMARRSILEQLLAQGVALNVAAAFAGFTGENNTQRKRKKYTQHRRS